MALKDIVRRGVHGARPPLKFNQVVLSIGPNATCCHPIAERCERGVIQEEKRAERYDVEAGENKIERVQPLMPQARTRNKFSQFPLAAHLRRSEPTRLGHGVVPSRAPLRQRARGAIKEATDAIYSPATLAISPIFRLGRAHELMTRASGLLVGSTQILQYRIRLSGIQTQIGHWHIAIARE